VEFIGEDLRQSDLRQRASLNLSKALSFNSIGSLNTPRFHHLSYIALPRDKALIVGIVAWNDWSSSFRFLDLWFTPAISIAGEHRWSTAAFRLWRTHHGQGLRALRGQDILDLIPSARPVHKAAIQGKPLLGEFRKFFPTS